MKDSERWEAVEPNDRIIRLEGADYAARLTEQGMLGARIEKRNGKPMKRTRPQEALPQGARRMIDDASAHVLGSAFTIP